MNRWIKQNKPGLTRNLGRIMSKEKQSKKDESREQEIVEETPVEAPAAEMEAVEDSAALDELRQLLTDAQEESSKNLDGWQRAQAEFMNYRKRMERDQARIYEDAAARVIKSFLPLMDDLNRALQNAPAAGEAGEWATGIELVYRKMQFILENEGVTLIESEGQMFDPNLHEAISQSESPDHESGQIIEVIQQGYMIGDRVLRAALVRVAS
ncbi:MAG TPA: nucleotide exchange factor GrpE [Chloroflexi bacterium]|nr:nucleotide exchange factor GrpE [Chloroflexota bacterium]